MTGYLPHEWDALADSGLTTAVQSLDELAALDRMAREAGKTIGYHLKIDSGMNRLGTPAAADEIILVTEAATL